MTSRQDDIRIDWHYDGPPDLLVGNGATPAEKGLTYVVALILGLLYLAFFLAGTYDWPLWAYGLAALMAADVGGGVVANSLNSGKRFYHTPPKPEEPARVRWAKKPLLFSALHIYPLLVGWLYGPDDWLYGLFWYGLVILGTVLVGQTPLHLRRPVAMTVALAALLCNAYLVTPVAGFEWFGPALILKIVVAHLVREEPYRPPLAESRPSERPITGVEQ